jgi:signal transduction histidine kinase
MVSKAITARSAAVGMAILALAVGILTPVLGRVEQGVHLGVVDGRVRVLDAYPYGPAANSGFTAGMIAVELNGQTLIQLPSYVYPSTPPTADPLTGAFPQPVPIGVDPTVATPVITDSSQLQALVDAPLTNLVAVREADLATWQPDRGAAFSVYASPWDGLRGSIIDVVAGIALLFAAAWWLGSGRAGGSLRELAYPVGLSLSAPFLLWPLDATQSLPGVVAFSVLMPVSMLPLAAALASRIETVPDRRLAIGGTAACFVGAVAIGASRLVVSPGAAQALPIAVLAGGITALPGIIAAGPWRQGSSGSPSTGAGGSPSSRVLGAAELGVAGATPFFAITTAIGPFAFPLPVWLVGVAIASRFTVRPLARLATRAQLQRDLIVAATEAERARVAADIHDDALQELTLLVRRLDQAGDTEGAEIARAVSDRLRTICGDLRLPILDDLGVGPALDWLVLRIERLAGGEVRLDRADGTRPPAEVELAFFRVAQEALANAVKHGRPPIVVRYRSTDQGVSLSIDDAGPGIAPDAAAQGEASGHFGLANMAQRAEQVGAILDVRRWPAGGTHVALEWRPH